MSKTANALKSTEGGGIYAGRKRGRGDVGKEVGRNERRDGEGGRERGMEVGRGREAGREMKEGR